MNKKEILQSYISLPKNVSVFFGELVVSKNNYRDRLLIFSGPLGEVKLNLKKVDPFGLGRLKISEDKQKIFIYHRSKKDLKPLKTLIQGKIYGVTIGYLVSLRIIGVGYRVFLQENTEKLKNFPIHRSNKITDQRYSQQKNLKNCSLSAASESFFFSSPAHTHPLRGCVKREGKLYKKNLQIKTENSDLSLEEKNLIFKMGYSHDIKYQPPKSVRGFVLEPTLLCIYGIDKNQVAEIANKIRKIRPPENYKGKGIRFVDEKITLLQGKRK